MLKVNRNGKITRNHGGKRSGSGRPKGSPNKLKEIILTKPFERKQGEVFRGMDEYIEYHHQVNEYNQQLKACKVKRSMGRPNKLKEAIVKIDYRVINVIKAKYPRFRIANHIGHAVGKAKYISGNGNVLFWNDYKKEYCLLQPITDKICIISLFRSKERTMEQIEKSFHDHRYSIEVKYSVLQHIINAML